MVGSREAGVEARVAPYPTSPDEIAQALVPLYLESDGNGYIIHGLSCEPTPTADVMRGVETPALGKVLCTGGPQRRKRMFRSSRNSKSRCHWR
jgi:2-keto-3-deoxy-galactonokinase